jgi:thioredoxin reductase (NADPH)
MTEPDQDEQFLIDSKGIAFPKLTYRQLALLEPLGKRRTLNKGEYLYKTGHREFGMTVVLTGAMEVIERCDGREHVISTKEPMDFVGEIAMFIGTASLVSVRGTAEASEILAIEGPQLRKALAELPGLGEPIVRAFMRDHL